MTNLVSHLLDVTRLQTGQALDLEREPTDLVTLVRAVVNRQPVAARQRIVVDIAADHLVALVDAPRLMRVVAHLLTNAVTYSPLEGAIHLSLSRRDHDRETWVVLVIRDAGRGIPADDLPHLFEPFWRGSNTSGDVLDTGLNLAAARFVMMAHGGTLHVESEERIGTTVTVQVPLNTDDLLPIE